MKTKRKVKRSAVAGVVSRKKTTAGERIPVAVPAMPPIRRARPDPEWPPGKPIPSFDNEEDEARFFETHSFTDAMEAHGGEELEYVPHATRPKARRHILKVRFDDEQMARLQNGAKQRGLTMADYLRQLVSQIEL